MTWYTTAPCPCCGLTSQVDIEPAQLALWRDGTYIQDVWPGKTAEERELILTGFHRACWDTVFGEEAT